MMKLQLTQFAPYLQPRPRDYHKGNGGHVLVVGGDAGYSGAVRLAAEAALRVGAGLVSVTTRQETAWMMNASRPEIMCHTTLLLEKASVVVIGPGLGQTPWARDLLKAVLASDKDLIVDADGLNMLAENPQKRSNWILTPHPGEAARLLKSTPVEVQSNRLAALQMLQKQYGGIIVLKGAGSLVGGADLSPVICAAGNPGMASAGMGDVLSGVIAGLAAQGLPLPIAAQCGVLIHAMAGDAAADAGERGMIASDLMPYLRQLVNEN